MKNCIILILLTSGFLLAQVKNPKSKIKPNAKTALPSKNTAVKQPIKPSIAIVRDTTQRANLRVKANEMTAHAHYPQGDIELFTHIAKTLKYSKQDIDKNTNGNVLIRFDVDIDSTIKEVRLIRNPCIDCGQTLINIFHNLKFAPALTKSGIPMRSNLMLEIPVYAH